MQQVLSKIFQEMRLRVQCETNNSYPLGWSVRLEAIRSCLTLKSIHRNFWKWYQLFVLQSDSSWETDEESPAEKPLDDDYDTFMENKPGAAAAALGRPRPSLSSVKRSESVPDQMTDAQKLVTLMKSHNSQKEKQQRLQRR